MHWVLQNNIFKEEAFDNLIDVLERFKIPYSEHRVVPFIGTLLPVNFNYDDADLSEYSDPKLTELSGPVICMGSYSMRHAAAKYNWTPGVFDLMEVGNFQNCIEHWGDLMLNADSIVAPFKQVSWEEGERFIRPTDDSKYFAGQVMERDDFLEWQKKVLQGEDFGNGLSAETLVQIAPLKKIYAEYRCWVVKGRIVTMSLYKRGDKVIYINMDDPAGNEARKFANSVLNHGNILLLSVNLGWQPAEAFCLDVCETDQGWRIVEINTLNSCGFYAANLTSLVLSLETAFRYHHEK